MFKISMGRVPPECLTGDRLWQSVSQTPFSITIKIPLPVFARCRVENFKWAGLSHPMCLVILTVANVGVIWFILCLWGLAFRML